MNCAKCHHPLPIVKRRVEPGGEWTRRYWTDQGAIFGDTGSTVICGWPGCEPREPSELRKALEGLVKILLTASTPVQHAFGRQLSQAKAALAGDER